MEELLKLMLDVVVKMKVVWFSEFECVIVDSMV